jgi:hypothetical protein
MVALVTLMNERLAVGGSTGPDYPDILNLARTLPGPSGKGTLLQDQAFRQMLADWVVRAEGYKLGKFRTMTALSKGQTPGPESSIGKVINANQLQSITNTAIEMQDHYGIIADDTLSPMDGAFQQGYLWAPGLRIAGGTDEILKNIIAERVLGLPQEQRADKGVAFKDLPTEHAAALFGGDAARDDAIALRGLKLGREAVDPGFAPTAARQFARRHAGEVVAA